MPVRPSKTIRLNFWKNDPKLSAFISVLGSKPEVRLGATAESFISIKEDGISISTGFGNNLNYQFLPQNIRFGGMVSPTPFPLSLIPSTIATPIPQNIIIPPLVELMSTIREMATISAAFVGMRVG